VALHEKDGVCLMGLLEGYSESELLEALEQVALTGEYLLFNHDLSRSHRVEIEQHGRTAHWLIRSAEGKGHLGRVTWNPRDRRWHAHGQPGRAMRRFRYYFRAVRCVVWNERTTGP